MGDVKRSYKERVTAEFVLNKVVPPMFSVKQAAARLAVTPETIRRWVRRGALSAQYAGAGTRKRILIPADSLNSFLTSTPERG